jgi:hypothetical protein
VVQVLIKSNQNWVILGQELTENNPLNVENVYCFLLNLKKRPSFSLFSKFARLSPCNYFALYVK